MLFVIHCTDAPGTGSLREQLQSAHQAYVLQHSARMLLGGPLLDDSGDKRIGSVIIIAAHGRAEAERIMAEEPYNRHGVFAGISIHAFQGVVFNPHLISGDSQE